MKNKTVIVTGGSTGIGKATALAFAKKGYNVVISGRNTSAGKEALKEIEETGISALFVPTDVTKEQDIIDLISKTKDTFGTVDVFVNNAGIAGLTEGFLADSSEGNLRNLFETNIMGVFFGMKHAIKSMQESGGGLLLTLPQLQD